MLKIIGAVVCPRREKALKKDIKPAKFSFGTEWDKIEVKVGIFTPWPIPKIIVEMKNKLGFLNNINPKIEIEYKRKAINNNFFWVKKFNHFESIEEEIAAETDIVATWSPMKNGWLFPKFFIKKGIYEINVPNKMKNVKKTVK